ncbi:MAG: hypothetical protein NTW86_06530, partial [Candidatus Sumerlaeota bacterium]|nr:hypothetical protein [Candidatus Sumerlaeota bacterium]
MGRSHGKRKRKQAGQPKPSSPLTPEERARQAFAEKNEKLRYRINWDPAGDRPKLSEVIDEFAEPLTESANNA